MKVWLVAAGQKGHEMRRIYILVVEDEALISEMVSEALSENGLDVHTGANGE
jgi:CheY-like chemotaxis protein